MDYVKTFDGTASYQITVHGAIENDLLENLGDLNLSLLHTKGKIISTLSGEITDQSALSGILNTLFDYQYTVISVSKLQ